MDLPALHTPVHTERLVLRSVTEHDLPVIRPLWIDTRVRRYLGGPVPGRQETKTVGAPGNWCVVRRSGQVVIGLVLLTPVAALDTEWEISYLFLPAHWGHGYAREAVTALLARGFDVLSAVGGARIVAFTQVGNQPSRRLLDAVGLSPVATFQRGGAELVKYAITPPRAARPVRDGSPRPRKL